MRFTRLTRFAEGAAEDERRDFGRALLAALDEIGVDAGGEFLVAAPEVAANLAEPDPGEHDANRLGAFAAGSSTSRQAALDNYPRSGKQKHTALVALYHAGERGLTSDELHKAHPEIPLQSAKPRLLELRRGGWAELNGEERPSLAGSVVAVHVITEKGRAAVEEREPPQAQLAAAA